MWNEGEFYQHQQGPLGANAYLHWPFDEDQLVKTIETMFGSSIQLASHTNPAISVQPGQPGDSPKAPELPISEITRMTVMLEPEASEPPSADPASIEPGTLELAPAELAPVAASESPESAVAPQSLESPSI
jgi:hypothetical protein